MLALYVLDDALLRPAGAARSLRSELAWREFHADVLWHWPDAARSNFDTRFDVMVTESGAAARSAFEQWCEG